MAVVFKYAFLAGLIAAQGIRYAYRSRAPRPRREGAAPAVQVSGFEALLMPLSFLGLFVLPLVYIFSNWLEFANYSLPVWAGVVGILLMLLSLYITWRAHADIQKSRSEQREEGGGPKLVTHGIYEVLRHPVYTAMVLNAIAQALLIQNWIAGLLGALTFLPIYILRMPQEERMMLEQFGDQYRDYMQRTNRVLPKIFR